MEGLRWILLIVGILLVVGIYYFDRFKRRTHPRADRSYANETAADLNMTPRPSDDDDDDDYHDTLAGLNDVLNENRSSGNERNVANGDSTVAPTDFQTDSQDYREEDQALAEAEIGIRDTADDDQQRIVVFYLKAPSGQAFAGSGLFEALAAVGLSLGDMGIYQDRNSYGDTIFSIANIFEPGTLDITDVQDFSTRGVALFMQLPLGGNSMDEQDAFERMLGKAEILAGRLGGELHDEHHQPLDDAGVARARATLKPA